MPYFTILIIVACACAYYQVGEIEYRQGVILAGVSLVVSCLTFFWLGWGALASIGAQLAIFVALTVINLLRKPRFR